MLPLCVLHKILKICMDTLRHRHKPSYYISKLKKKKSVIILGTALIIQI